MQRHCNGRQAERWGKAVCNHLLLAHAAGDTYAPAVPACSAVTRLERLQLMAAPEGVVTAYAEAVAEVAGGNEEAYSWLLFSVEEAFQGV